MSSALQNAYLVDAHLFLVAAGQLVKTLRELQRADLLALIPNEHVTHARNAMEHDDERGDYRRDYQGYGWTVGPAQGRSGPSDIYGLAVEPLVHGLKEVAEQLGPDNESLAARPVPGYRRVRRTTPHT